MSQVNDSREFVHRIDPSDRICFVNAAWLAFARENDWKTSADGVIGSPLMSHISDAETRHIYRLLINRARAGARPAEFHYRCDSPGLRRLMEMRVSNLGAGQVEFCSRVLRLERRDPVRVLDPALRQRTGNVLRICSWCKAACVGTAWLELEEAVQRLGILAASVLPPISHGICPACSERMKAGAGQ